MSPIQRLKKTWGKVNKDKFEILEVRIFFSIRDCENNVKKLKQNQFKEW